MKKVSKLKTAILYAQSMYAGAGNDKQRSAMYADAQMLKDILSTNKAEFSKLNNPLWKFDDKVKVLELVAQKMQLTEPMLNTLKLLLQNGRFDTLGMTLEQFILLYQDKHGIAEIEVTTAAPLSSSQENLLKEKLAAIFKKEILLSYIINPQIIGGLIIKYGTHFIDNSIKHKLNALEQLMKGTK